MLVGVVDYGVGNIANVIRCLEYISTTENIVRVHSYEELKQCDKIVLPGVGAFGSAMQCLRKRGLDKALLEYAESGRYLLGICLGMQLLLDKSYEFGNHSGLGLIRGEVVKFGSQESLKWHAQNLDYKRCIESEIQITQEFNRKLKNPHIGWNKNFIKKPHDLCLDVKHSCYLYFVHSYHACCDNSFIIATCDYGISFPSIIGYDNVLGIQPHPERSHATGFKLMQRFLKLT